MNPIELISSIITYNKIKDLNEGLYDAGTALNSVMIRQYNDENTIVEISRRIDQLEENVMDLEDILEDEDNIENDSITGLNNDMEEIKSKLDELTDRYEDITTTNSEANYEEDFEDTDASSL